MPPTTTSNKRIAINTIIVYFRLFVVMVVGLLTSRFVLQRLGVSDYGLYNVVGGVIAIFTVISGSMSSTTIRFLNYEIGKTDGNPNRVFNICNVTHISFAVGLLFLAETIGLFYVYNYLKVDPGKENDAMFVFQVSTIVACIGLINVPFQSVFVAKEKFLAIALIEIINAFVKLGLIVLLLYYKGNALRLYAIIMSATTFISFVVYHYLCYRYWPDLVKWRFIKRFKYYKELLVYNNYVMLSSVAYVGRAQGANILINYFFGTLVNGAYGIARTVEGFVMNFTVNFDSAAAPQITQSVGKGDISTASTIACRTCRMCILLSLLAVFPLYVEMELVLKFWLGTVPEYTVTFCRLMLLAVVVAATGGGFLRLKDAMGKIKWFMIQYSFWYFLSFPLGYILLKMGYPPLTVIVVYIFTDLVNRICQIYLMKRIYNFDIKTFCINAYIRPFIVALLMSSYFVFYSKIDISNSTEHFVGLCITAFIGVSLILIVGLKASERSKIIEFVRKLFRRRRVLEQ